MNADAVGAKRSVHKREKKTHIELLRVIAIYFVIFNHSGGFFVFPLYDPESFAYWAALFVSIFCKFAVPVFFAISGALLLNRPPEPLAELWKKRILKFAVILLLASFYAYLDDIGFFQYPGYALQQFSWKVFIKQIYSIDLRTHLWYLYAYIAFLILLPVLQTLARNLETKYFYYIIIAAFVYKAVLPVAEYLIWKGDYTLNSSFTLGWIAEDVVLFPCVGYFLEHRARLHNSGKKVALLWLGNLICLLIACYMTWFRGNLMGGYSPEASQYFHKSFDLVGCITIYTSVRYLCERIHFAKWFRHFIWSVGECTFGIFLFHLLLDWEEPVTMLASWISDPVLCSLVSSAVVLVGSWLFTLVIKKLPGIRKLL